jgi:hypothetical protein
MTTLMQASRQWATRPTKPTVKQFDTLRKTGLGLATTLGTKTTLWPNGEREIWVKSADGTQGFSVRFSEGPYGLSLQVNFLHLRTPPDIRIEEIGTYVGICQYRSDPKSQAFKRWYVEEETEADIALLGDGYRRAKQGA